MSYHREAQYMANMIDIKKAEMGKLEEYKTIFNNCSLYNHYFKKTDLLDQWLTNAIKKGEGFVAVDRNGEAVGWATICPCDPLTDNLPHLMLLAVKENFRGRGIGQMMIHFYTEVMKGLGCEECAIIVSDWNPRARKLYDSLGFKLRKSMEDPVVGGFIDHILVKKL